MAPFADVTEAQFLGKVFGVPVLLLRQVLWYRQCRKLFRGPQVQFLGKVFGVPVVQRQVFGPDSAEICLEVPLVQFLARLTCPSWCNDRRRWGPTVRGDS